MKPRLTRSPIHRHPDGVAPSYIRRTLALCSILLILGSVVETGSAADVSARKVDEFFGVGWEDAMARLDNFALSLQNDPSSIGIIFVYGGQDRRRGEAEAWSTCVRDYLVKRRAVPADRIVMIKGGYRNKLTVELWDAPDRTNTPKATPEIKPGALRFKGKSIKKWQSLCSL